MNKHLIGLTICGIFFMSCNDVLRCEKHYLPKNHLGKVTILFDQKNGQKEIDADGCIVYKIPSNGICNSGFPFKSGNIIPNETFAFLEKSTDSSYIRLPEFREATYLQDTVGNKMQKFVFFLSSGYEYPNNFFRYAIDYGVNYKKYGNIP